MASASQEKGKGRAIEEEDEDGASVSYASYITRPALPLADPAAPSRSSATNASSERSKAKPPNSSRRLYIGNLHPAVDEYLLASTFAKYGKIAKLDFLFHKTGPMKGKPRGYAFVEYEKIEEAMHALAQTNDNTLRGRKLAVSFATASPEAANAGTGPHRHAHRDHSDATRPTTLSLIKNASQPRGVDAKIAAMEAKLAQLKGETSRPISNQSGSTGTLKAHPSLPSKPNFQARPPR